MIFLPKEEERPVDNAKDEVHLESIVKSSLQEIPVINEVDDRLSDEEHNGEDKSHVKETSELRLVECRRGILAVEV